MTVTNERISPGVAGAGAVRRLYRRLPARWLYRVALPEALLPGNSRLIKTHELFQPAYRRVIHIVRDPRDAAVSFFHYLRRIGKILVREGDDVPASFDRFIGAYILGRLDSRGDWRRHTLSFVDAERSGAAEFLRLRYEDLHAAPVDKVLEIGDWLKLSTDRLRAEAVAARCSFEAMQASERRELDSDHPALPAAAIRSRLPTVRDGRVGGWRAVLTDAQQRRFAAWVDALALMGYPPA
ncbi:hypothetical protein BH24CHL5_BH24CHL5_04250 [soil metagenome]